jgi:hypothetical protein
MGYVVLIYLAYEWGPVAGSCEYADEPLGSAMY